MKYLDTRENYNNDIEGIQYVLLRILTIVTELCEKNNIIYWVDSGTLLGTIRHKGFIPWDDDIDICIPREYIKKFKIIMKENLPEDLFLQDFETDKGIQNQIIRVRDRYSKTEERETEYHNGISIDIFPMDSIKENIVTRNFNFLFLFGKTGRNAFEYKGIKKKIFLIREKIGFNRKKIFQIFSKNKQKNNGYIYFEGECWAYIFPKEKIFPLKKSKFQNVEVFIPQDHDFYLKKLYGANYMKLPKENQRRIHHSLNELSLTECCKHKESLSWKDRK